VLFERHQMATASPKWVMSSHAVIAADIHTPDNGVRRQGGPDATREGLQHRGPAARTEVKR